MKSAQLIFPSSGNFLYPHQHTKPYHRPYNKCFYPEGDLWLSLESHLFAVSPDVRIKNLAISREKTEEFLDRHRSLVSEIYLKNHN